MNKDKPSTSNQQKMIGNFFMLPKELNYISFHHLELNIDNPFENTKMRAFFMNISGYLAFVAHIEPKSFLEAKNDDNWILAIQDELNQFEKNNVWKLVFRPNNQFIIETKWVFKNKIDEYGTLVRNKVRIDVKNYNKK